MHAAQLPYRHRQPGILLRVVMVAAIALAVLIGATVSSGAGAVVVTVLVAALLGVCLWLFNSLTVEVDRARLRLWFGPGAIQRTFATDQILRCRVVRNRWYYGWGVRLTPRGWLFAVSGLNAVQITMRSGRRYRIGTDDPRGLLVAVREAIDARWSEV